MLTAPAELGRLLAAEGFAGARERPFPNDGWSGARLTSVERGGRRAIIKRISPALDWIVRATGDRHLREAWLAAAPLDLPDGVVAPYLGVAREGELAAIVMPDLSGRLISWVEGAPPVSPGTLERVLGALGLLHSTRWWPEPPAPPWCPLDRRLTLLARPSAERYRREGLAVGERFLAGWDAFDRQAPEAARDLVAALAEDPNPLLAALGRLPAAGLHGDLKLSNVGLLDGGKVALVDWQMTLRAPIAVELGWLLVSNVALLPEPPEAVLDRYRPHAADDVIGDWEAQADLAWIVGLLLRGWRKGLEAEAAGATGWGVAARDDLSGWCRRAVDAADRRL